MAANLRFLHGRTALLVGVIVRIGDGEVAASLDAGVGFREIAEDHRLVTARSA
jgi:hypothetical protein